MKRIKQYMTLLAAAIVLAAVSGTSQAAVTQQIEPTTIGLGEAAQLTITASGADAAAITPPMVAGLEFVAVGQSQQIESINGVTHSTTAITYQVVPRQAGVFTIPSATPGSQPVVLTVNDAGSPGHAASSGTGLPPPASGTMPGGPTHVTANGSAFVRLRLAKHDLYVGESIPVDIQVGTRDGVVASLDGPPTLNGDAFTLAKLSSQPQRTEEVIDGKPYTVFTWHSALAAVKPGSLSLTMETPLTVRIRSGARPDTGLFGGMDLDDFFNDPTLQNFFGTSTEKQVTVASSPTTFTVLALPTQGRPADFSGAVGRFTVSSNVSDEKAAVGDPITLHLHVSGSGNFDRVSTPMLQNVDGWKTYAPTATFKPEDEIGYRGEKTFDQPLIALQPGTQSVPPLNFSWFDPESRRYVEARTSPLRVAIAPAAGNGSSLAQNTQPQSTAGTTGAAGATGPLTAGSAAANGPGGSGLRPDHVDTGARSESLLPHYYQARYIVAPSLLALAFLAAGFWVRRRDRLADEWAADREREASLETEPMLQQMDQAASSSDVPLFFKSARQAVQRALASRWRVPPANITIEEAEARLGAGTEVARLFELADEANYSKINMTAIDFKHWRNVVLRQINSETVS